MKYLFPLLALALLLASCASSRKTIKSDTTTTTPAETHTFAARVLAQRTQAQGITAKMNLRIEAGKKNVSVGGNFRALRDDVIQIQLVFLGIKEVGRLELTRDSILLVDRINRQYIHARYADIPYLRRAGITFRSFQALFWGELFVPGQSGETPAPDDFREEKLTKTVCLSHKDKELALQFVADAATALLQTTSVSSTHTSLAAIESSYQNWTTLGRGRFPAETTLTLAVATGGAYKATFRLSSLRESTDWATRTEVNTKKYRAVSPDAILRQIMKLAK